MRLATLALAALMGCPPNPPVCFDEPWSPCPWPDAEAPTTNPAPSVGADNLLLQCDTDWHCEFLDAYANEMFLGAVTSI